MDSWNVRSASNAPYHAAAAAESLQSCPTLCNRTDGSPPGSAVPGMLQARTLEWVAISFSSAWKWRVKVKSLSRVRLLVTPWTAAHQAPPSMGFSRREYWSGVTLPSPTYHAEQWYSKRTPSEAFVAGFKFSISRPHTLPKDLLFSHSVVSKSFATLWTAPYQAPLSMGFFPGKSTGVSCHFLLQQIFPTQRSNLHLLRGRQIIYHWATWEAQSFGLPYTFDFSIYFCLKRSICCHLYFDINQPKPILSSKNKYKIRAGKLRNKYIQKWTGGRIRI